MEQTVRIGVVGDFNPALRMHLAISESFQHAAERLKFRVQAEWAPAPAITRQNVESVLGGHDGLWVAPASPYQSFEGALAAIEFARKRSRPLVST